MVEGIVGNILDIADRTKKLVGGSIASVAGDLIARGVPATLGNERFRQKSADMLAVGINEATNDVKANAGPIVADLNHKIANGNQPGISETLRENLLKPGDSWLSRIGKRLFARLIGAGVGIAAHLTAGAINVVTAVPESKKVAGDDVYNIFAKLFSTLFRKKVQPTRTATNFY